MQTIIQDIFEEITHDLRNLKSSRNEDQVIVEKFLKMID